MHHEKEISPEIYDSLKQKSNFGPTGKFPEGKLTSNDEGELEFGVTEYNQKIVVNFGTPIASLGMSVNQARQLALSLRRYANLVEKEQRQFGKK